MDLGAILLPASTAERHPAVPADIPRPIMEITASRPVRGASTAMHSTAEARLVPAAAHRPMTTPITAIPMARGQERTIRSTSAAKPAPFAAIARRSMAITRIPTQMVFAMIVAQMSR